MQKSLDVAVVRLCGDFDVADRERLAEAFEGVRDARTVIVDLAETGYVDLTLINCLIALRNRRDPTVANGRVILRGLSGHVRRLMAITQVDGLFGHDDGAPNDGLDGRTSCEIIVLAQ